MRGYTIDELMVFLQSVRGETRVKATEETIRKNFLQAACDEIFSKYDWEFNRKKVEVEIDSDGNYEMPEDFSVFNGFSLSSDKNTYEESDVTITTERNKIVIYGPTEQKLTLTYFIKAPYLLEDSSEKVYFPQPMLIADRAYVRLKTAYFPDQDSKAEMQKSEIDLRSLFVGGQPKPVFNHFSWR